MSRTLRTPLHDEHQRLGARETLFAGWEMPLFYHDIHHEHRAVREAAGLFDLSHMGRLEVTGRDRAAFLDRLSTNRLIDLEPGRARYTALCDDAGGAVDDLVVFCDAGRSWVVPNAVNREIVLAWLGDHASGFATQIADRTFEMGMLALQGPRAAEILGTLGVTSLETLRYFGLRPERLLGVAVTLSRTGYTGEDGFEIMAPADRLAALWTRLLEAGKPLGLVPAGLGARDTLRIEAGLILYGHELTRERNPIEAGMTRFVKFKDREFIGREKLLAAARDENPETLRLVGLTLASGRIGRTGQDILSDGRPAGIITSGTFSPTLAKSISMGYVPMRLSAVGPMPAGGLRPAGGSGLSVRVSHEDVPAVVSPLPFYSRRK